MKQLISLITAFFLLPTGAFAQQQFGGGFYQPHHNNWQQNQVGGDTVVYDGRVLTNNLPPNTDTCGWVRGQGLSCQYERWDDRTRTHFVRSIPNNSWGHNNSGNWNNQWQNPGWNNNQQWRHPTKIWQNNSGCVYQNQHVRILCN